MELMLCVINIWFRRATQLYVTWLLRLSWPVYIIHIHVYSLRWPWRATGIFWYSASSDVWQLGQCRRSPRHWLSLVSCHFSISLRFLDRFESCTAILATVRVRVRFFLLLQIQIREIFRKADRNPTPWELWRTRESSWPFGYRFETSKCESWMQKGNDHVALMCNQGG